MKKRILHIGIQAFVALLFFASTGVSFEQLYCYCKGEFSTALFQPSDPCGMADAGSGKRQSSCCGRNACERDTPSPQKNCSDTETVYLKLETNYVVSDSGLRLQDHQPFSLPTPLPPQSASLVPSRTARNHPAAAGDLPPPPFGKMLRVRVQSFLC